MANDNKKKKHLAGIDDDPTSEMEIPTWRRDESDSFPILETAADTFGLGKKTRKPDDRVRRLEFELEQQRALRAGLEAEVAARDEITSELNSQVDRLGEELSAMRSKLSERDASIRDLKLEIKDRNALYRDLDQELSDLKIGVETQTADAAHRDDELDDQKKLVTKLEEELEAARSRIEALQDLGESRDGALKNAEAALEEKAAELEDSRALLASRDREIEDLRAAGSKPDNAAMATPLLASKDREIRELTAALRQAEAHTDGLRQKLQDQIAIAGQLGDERDALHESLERKKNDIVELKATVEAANERIESLEKQLSVVKENHAEEIRMIRFELGEAQATVSQHELINEQLASDLLQTRGFKESLEEMLTESERSQQSEIDRLTRKLKASRDEVSRFEQQIQTKNEAINCLLAELAAKREQAPAEKDIDSTDASELLPEETAAERLTDGERVTRFLIGNVDGRQVQFPLFKTRLTIGRTSTNDIQLTADYISRRHAVIVSEGDATRIIDWGSRNGVFVNSERVTEHFLSSGDRVTIATFDFLYEERKRGDKG